MKAKNTIEINGRIYDARTGDLIEGQQPKKAKVATAAAATGSKKSTQFIDGIQRRSTTTATPKNTTSRSTPTTPAAKKPEPITRSKAPQATTKPKRSLTLRREAVSAPIFATSKDLVNEKPVAKTPSIVKKIDPQRVARAKQITRSSAIHRFGVTPIDSSPKSREQPTVEKKVLPVPPAKTTAPTAPKEVATKTTPTKTKRSLFRRKRTAAKHKILRHGSTALVALLLVGYVTYLNVPGISMKVAAHRAGFAAHLPSYKPSGYSLQNPINYSPGQVTISFHSNTDDRHFSLQQQPSSWDSEALKENFVALQDKNYQTFQDRGLTIYIYNDTNAAWVNNGEFYNIKGNNAQLDAQQLLEVATSA